MPPVFMVYHATKRDIYRAYVGVTFPACICVNTVDVPEFASWKDYVPNYFLARYGGDVGMILSGTTMEEWYPGHGWCVGWTPPEREGCEGAAVYVGPVSQEATILGVAKE